MLSIYLYGVGGVRGWVFVAFMFLCLVVPRGNGYGKRSRAELAPTKKVYGYSTVAYLMRAFKENRDPNQGHSIVKEEE